MTGSGLASFDCAIGRCGIAWRGEALAGILLPEGPGEALERRLSRRFPDLAFSDPPRWIEQAIGRICGLLGGEADDLLDVRLDFSDVAPFEASVYRAARAIPPGRTVTYGELAREIGDVGHARAVGQALGRNPWPIVVPCHRVTAADGRMGGFSAPGGRSTKLRLLELEGALDAARLPLFGSPGRA